MRNIIRALENQLNRDIERQKKIVLKDSKQHFLHYNKKRRVFLGLDENSVGWIAGPKTDVPCYWIYCDNTIDYATKGEIKSKRCNKPHFIPIYRDGDDFVCVECGEIFKIEIVLPKDVPQNNMLQRIREEKKTIQQ